jgi:plastocyanin
LPETSEQQRPVRYYLGPYRAATGAGRVEPSPFVNVVIYIDGAPRKAAPDAVSAQAVVRQRQDRFVPHVLAVVAGTTVSFPNDDNYYHNVFSIVAGDRFDLGRYGRGESADQLFEQPAVVVVRCEIHAGMKAYIVVLDSELFSVPDKDGRYELEAPAGSYTLKAWHPEGVRSYQVDVPESDSVTVDISL